MKLRLLPIMMGLMTGSVCWSVDNIPYNADNIPFHGAPMSSVAKRHVSVCVALSDYNQVRLDRSKEFEENVGAQKIAEALPQDLIAVLKEKTKGKEFSRPEVVQPLLRKINPHIAVTKVIKMEGGFVSGQIYRVLGVNAQTEQQETFFIKYLRTKPILVSKGRTYGEQVNLQALAQAAHLQEIQRHIDVMLPIASYEYRANKKRKVFMVIPGAKGESFTRIVGHGNLEETNSAFAKLGEVLGRIHRGARSFDASDASKIPTTLRDFIEVRVLAHGDLHGDNVFYDKDKARLSLIDVETMANSFDEEGKTLAPICYDMFYMLLMSSKKFGSFMPDNKWAPFLHMFRSYIATYPDVEREGIYDYLVYCLSHTDRIKFTDIFESFTIDKGFGTTRIAGAQVLAAELKKDKQAFIQQRDGTQDRVRSFKSRPIVKYTSPKQVKDLIEQRYDSMGVMQSSAASSSASSSSSSDTVDVISALSDPVIAADISAVSKPIAKPFSDAHLVRLGIKPSNVRNLKAFWSNPSAQNKQ